MNLWTKALREGLVAGTVGGLLSGAALALAGRRETGYPAAPINAVSHWFWPEAALRADRPSLRYTVVGFATHHAAAVLWGTAYARARAALRPHHPPSLAGAVATSAVAAVVDYTMTPKRFTPGYEHRLTKSALVTVYACLAIGLLLGAELAEQEDGPQHLGRLP
ncbi:hypothetical protein WG922_03285 [Ramlibacter sp. AN1015]|uniref:hypothetical protein n=1 Tax=Ramlibacter sp. AN1015 TaxID=3133428 RepID=UPI0030BF74BD